VRLGNPRSRASRDRAKCLPQLRWTGSLNGKSPGRARRAGLSNPVLWRFRAESVCFPKWISGTNSFELVRWVPLERPADRKHNPGHHQRPTLSGGDRRSCGCHGPVMLTSFEVSVGPVRGGCSRENITPVASAPSSRWRMPERWFSSSNATSTAGAQTFPCLDLELEPRPPMGSERSSPGPGPEKREPRPPRKATGALSSWSPDDSGRE